jgi:predicted transcriptional regulator
MTQEETYQFLKKKDKWMTTQEIAQELNVSDGSISKNLNKLCHHGDIIKKTKRSNFNGGTLWKVK